MAEQTWTYLIVGGVLAGASAVQGIRELDKNGAILLMGDDSHLPYDRPPSQESYGSGRSSYPLSVNPNPYSQN